MGVCGGGQGLALRWSLLWRLSLGGLFVAVVVKIDASVLQQLFLRRHFSIIIYFVFLSRSQNSSPLSKSKMTTSQFRRRRQQPQPQVSIMRADMKTSVVRLVPFALFGLVCVLSSPPLTLAFATNFPASRAGFGGIGTSTSSSSLSSTAPVEEAELVDTEIVASSKSKSKSKTKIIAEDDEFIKPDLDTRQYRAITLANNLTCLLVSDPLTDVEAGSIHINSGHFQDPAHRPGLAHFHEHMLFLGTEKYPNENGE